VSFVALVDLVKQTGLNDYESRAIAALLEKGSSFASEVSRKSGIPRARVYDVLASLEKKGFLVEEPGRPARYKALHPEAALSNLEKAKRQSLEAELKQLSLLKKEIAAAIPLGKQEQDSFGETVLLNGRQKILSAFSGLLRQARSEVVVCTNEQNALNKALEIRKALRSHDGKKPAVSFHSPSTIKLDKHFGLELENISFKQTDAKARFAVFDSKKVLLFLQHEAGKEDEKAVLLESPFIAAFLKNSLVG
jgi:sugar-specific transcriptional regulator TrmB